MQEQIGRPKNHKRKQGKRDGRQTRKQSDRGKHKKHLSAGGIKIPPGYKNEVRLERYSECLSSRHKGRQCDKGICKTQGIAINREESLASGPCGQKGD